MRKVILALLLTVFVVFTGLTIWMQFNPAVQSEISEQTITTEPEAAAKVAGTTAESLEQDENVVKPTLWQRIVALFRGGKPPDKGYGFKYGECSRWGVANKCKAKD
ncbi:hypothetical protein GCM10008927_14120 [Amylibacter ulvae]|uniref:Uncharacterized protein n=1 Tax=Paramylibacter ulvae TaxID=1651968 RepID=A0ABQ3D022_9RHOB|nr:hypothetical protein [Amylibacter ulvae]GHA50295.1 hypothetical protein GCM10008927_14120 [Amylibacter ulvae]